MAINVNFTLGQFPSGFCWQTPQQYADALVALLSGSIAGNFTGVIKGANPPAVADQDKLWVKTDSNGRPVGIFLFNGQWLWPHPIAPSAQERRIWVGSEAASWSYDGGDGSDPSSSAPTPTTGAMWQPDHSFDFRVPVGAGTNSQAYDGNPASVIGVGTSGGEERHTLSSAENGAHSHKLFTTEVLSSDTGQPGTADPVAVETSIGNNQSYKALKSAVTPPTLGVTSSVGSLSHQNMQPYYGVFFLKRTARIYVVGG